ncbi:hypothetical protein ACIRF8_12905 [Streptomyces sp. NPDC102406]
MTHMPHFHRTTYSVPGRGAYRATWWQVGNRIIRHREHRLA